MTGFEPGDRVLYGDPRPLTEGDGDVGTVLETLNLEAGGQLCRVKWDKGANKIETIAGAQLIRVLYETPPSLPLFEVSPAPSAATDAGPPTAHT